MPSGRTHEQIALATSPALAAGVGALLHAAGRPPLEALMGAALLTASHLACTRWLSPDLDLGGSDSRGRWGMLAPIWRPYERAIPHRHWLSHSGLSALLRLLYLYLALNAVLVLVGLVMLAQAALIAMLVGGTPGGRALALWLLAQYLAVTGAGIELVPAYPVQAGALLGGAVTSDVVHTIADKLDTARKRRRLRLRFGVPRRALALVPFRRARRRSRRAVFRPLRRLRRR
jgi:uncharacterized metal-binding protein